MKLTFSIIIFLFANMLFADQVLDMPHGDHFDLDCAQCHNESTWQVQLDKITFDHSATGFPLTGLHKTVNCIDCHTSLEFNKVGINCIDCHQDVHKNELGINCENCHSPQSWENRMDLFEAHQQTDFPLLGVHALLDCQSCHQTEQQREFVNTSVLCKSCHLENYMQTLNPAHQKADFDLNCENCHLPNAFSWKQAIFIHNQNFPLTAGHANLECIDCHSSTYIGVGVDCYSCHQLDYENALDPPHKEFSFPTLCETCHSSTTWETTSFDHLQVSGFELRGAHAISVLCTDCHVNNQLTGLGRNCIDCHQQDYNETDNPAHLAGSFSTNCLDCHSETAWTPATFNHDETNFPLIGAHITTDCISCHKNGQFSGTPTDCWSCHQSDFNNTTDPNHATNNFSQLCTDCHTTTAWSPATFNHDETNFPLTGAHISIDCNSCHENGQFSGTPTDCWSCHESDFNSTTDPDHVINNFSQQCTDCHSTTAWSPATFDHNTTEFPLTGAHTSVNCTECHSTGYTNTPMECIACHQDDYDNTSDPNHRTAQFPTNCTECHTTTAWSPSTFDHDNLYFPIYSGKHQNEWNTCSDCHINAADYKAFECINCHEHNNPTDLAGKHNEVQNYEYNSAACYSCHPDGRAEDD